MVRFGLNIVLCTTLLILFAGKVSVVRAAYLGDEDEDLKAKIKNSEFVEEEFSNPDFSTDTDYSLLVNEPIDSMVTALYHSNIMGSFEDFINDFILLDSIQIENEKGMTLDSIYKTRLELMSSVVKLPYNEIVRTYINTYTKGKNPRIGWLLGLSLYYMPIFEQELFNQGLPTELKILPIIESALNPRAVSPAGAGGLWQFMYGTGKMYGLRVNSFIDERLDPIASTKAACKYLKSLYEIYNDWALVLAAYNCGPGNVNKALKRAPNAKSYWDIYYYLPSETRGYVPAFIGATYAYTFHKAHDIEIKMPLHPIVTDTVAVHGKTLYFKDISSTLDIHIDTLRALNPMYRRDVIPASNERMSLTLPLNYIMSYIDKESEIAQLSEVTLNKRDDSDNLKEMKDGFIIHRIKSGDTLGALAAKYRVKSSNIMKWNNITNPKKLQLGQKIKIYR